MIEVLRIIVVIVATALVYMVVRLGKEERNNGRGANRSAKKDG